MSVQEIAERFGTSVATARRDIDTLAAAGRVRRSRGGALAMLAEGPRARSPLPPPDNDAIPMLQEKRRIALAAATLVRDGDTVGLSGGTTSYQLARCLRGRAIGAVTNAVDIALELAGEPGPRVVLVGGVLDLSYGHELLGPFAEAMLAQLHIDLLFVSLNGISAAAGATIIGELNAQVMRAMAARARRVVAIADRTKLGRTALSRLLPLQGLDTLVTDAAAPSPELELIRRAGLRVVEA